MRLVIKTQPKRNTLFSKSTIALTLTLGAGLFNSAQAGDPNVASVSGEANPGILANRINVSNNGDSYTNTQESTAPMRVGGLVMCKKKSQFDTAY